jgi:hypothetical protein
VQSASEVSRARKLQLHSIRDETLKLATLRWKLPRKDEGKRRRNTRMPQDE